MSVFDFEDRKPIVEENNVIDLASQRAARMQKHQSEDQPDEETETDCENGICAVKWRPQRPAA